jgi:putative protease
MMTGASVFLIDRKEPELEKQISSLQKELDHIDLPKRKIGNYSFVERKQGLAKGQFKEMRVFRNMPKAIPSGRVGFWIDEHIIKQTPTKMLTHHWWWLPPVVWPDQEDQFRSVLEPVLQRGGKNFVLNAPWQVSLFELSRKLNLWAGPFCNVSNPGALMILKKMGFKGAIVSPELGGRDLLELPSRSPIHLGVVFWGNWPLCISRTISEDMEIGKIFSSPKNEEAWVQKYGSNFWLYPNWRLDIRNRKEELVRAGYSLFVNISEPVPGGIRLKKRPGQWNWDIGLV